MLTFVNFLQIITDFVNFREQILFRVRRVPSIHFARFYVAVRLVSRPKHYDFGIDSTFFRSRYKRITELVNMPFGEYSLQRISNRRSIRPFYQVEINHRQHAFQHRRNGYLADNLLSTTTNFFRFAINVIAFTIHRFQFAHTHMEELSVEIDHYQEKDYTDVDTKIERLGLKPRDRTVLDCYMAGMTCNEIADFLDISRITVWRRRTRAQVKYKALFF